MTANLLLEDCEELVQSHIDARDAVRRPDIAMYNAWAMDGRDVVMEITHSTAFEQAWQQASTRLDGTRPFTAVDAGCGNGWATRKLALEAGCKFVKGVDAAACMVDRAEVLSASGYGKVSFEIADISTWVPDAKVQLVNLSEVLYFCDDPRAVLEHICGHWLSPRGVVMATMDWFDENKMRHSWDLGVGMRCLSQRQWRYIFKAAGMS